MLIEVAPFAYAKLLQNLHHLGAPQAALRMAKAKAGPVVSDNGNFIIDAPFPRQMLADPYSVRREGFSLNIVHLDLTLGAVVFLWVSVLFGVDALSRSCTL